MSIIIDYLILWECPQNPLSKAQSQIHSISSYYYSLNLMSFYLSTADSTGFISPDFVIFSSNHGTVQYTKIHIIKQKKTRKVLGNRATIFDQNVFLFLLSIRIYIV